MKLTLEQKQAAIDFAVLQGSKAIDGEKLTVTASAVFEYLHQLDEADHNLHQTNDLGENDDGVRFFRGVMIALALSLPIWLIAISLVIMTVRLF